MGQIKIKLTKVGWCGALRNRNYAAIPIITAVVMPYSHHSCAVIMVVIGLPDNESQINEVSGNLINKETRHRCRLARWSELNA